MKELFCNCPNCRSRINTDYIEKTSIIVERHNIDYIEVFCPVCSQTIELEKARNEDLFEYNG